MSDETQQRLRALLDAGPIDPARLRLAMDLAGVTAAELARRAGVSEAYVSQLLNGKRRAKRATDGKARLAEALGVPIDWIETKESGR